MRLSPIAARNSAACRGAFAVLMMPLVKQTAQMGIANRIGVIILYVVFFMPMNMMLYTGYLKNIPIALEEAACVDGATAWQTYWKIIFPNMKPMHATVAVLTAMSTWNDVMTPLVIMSGTDQNTLPLAQLNFQTVSGNYSGLHVAHASTPGLAPTFRNRIFALGLKRNLPPY